VRSKFKIQVVGFGLIALIFLIGRFLVPPEQMALTMISLSGFFALLGILFVLSVPLITRKWRNKLTVSLMANQRWTGIFVFLFALVHVILVYHFFFKWDFAMAAENFYRNLGLMALLALAAMAGTSNDWAIRVLGKNWKKLHHLIYLVLILIISHSFELGKIFLANTGVKIVIALVVLVLFLLKFHSKVLAHQT